MGDLLLVTLPTSFTVCEMTFEMERTDHALLLEQELLPVSCPEHLEQFARLINDDETGYLLHFIVDRDVAVTGDSVVAYLLECRRQAALELLPLPY